MGEREMTVSDYIELCEWYDTLPRFAQHLIEKYHFMAKWQLAPGVAVQGFEEGDWLQTIGIEVDGSLDMYHYKGVDGRTECRVAGVPPCILRPLVMH